MPFLADLYRILWQAHLPELTYNPDTAIYKLWLQRRDLGSPISDEIDLMDDQSTDAHIGQVFANGYVLWSPSRGAWVA